MLAESQKKPFETLQNLAFALGFGCFGAFVIFVGVLCFLSLVFYIASPSFLKRYALSNGKLNRQ